MKNYYLTLVCAAAALLGFWSCSKTDYNAAEDGTRQIEVSLKTPPAGLSCPLHIFRRPAGTSDEYAFDRNCGPVADGTTLKLTLEELKAFDYRFLMTAQPASRQWLEVTGDAQELTAGTLWNDVRLAETSTEATSEAYCGVTDMSGDDIIRNGRILMELKRIGGEMVFDIYRKGATLDDPVSIVSTDVASVIDRVTRIEIRYYSPTVALRFGPENELIPDSYGSTPVVQAIIPSLDGNLRAVLPQSDNGLAEYDPTVRGSLRIMGAFLLPSDSRIRATMKFTYYDTTPVCGNSHTGDHTDTCFEEKTLLLNLPSALSATGLPVKGNFFTVNRAGLGTDRIIDVPTESGVDVDFTWK